jgi:hypothetical protein
MRTAEPRRALVLLCGMNRRQRQIQCKPKDREAERTRKQKKNGEAQIAPKIQVTPEAQH